MYGSQGASCDATCAAAEDVGPCVEEGFKTEWTSDLMKKALIEPSAELDRKTVVKCDRYEESFDETILPLLANISPYINGGYPGVENFGECGFPSKGGNTSTCAALPDPSSRRMCPCGCPFGTTAAGGTSKLCEM